MIGHAEAQAAARQLLTAYGTEDKTATWLRNIVALAYLVGVTDGKTERENIDPHASENLRAALAA